MTVAGRPSDLADPSVQPLRDPLDALWRALCRPLTAQILLLLIALALVLAQIIPQMPAAARADAKELARWLVELPLAFRPAAGWLRPLGLFHIYHAGWFRFLLALAGLSLTITLVDELLRLRRFLWGQTTEGAPAGAPALAGLCLEDTLAGLRDALLARRYLLRVQAGERETVVRAARWPAPALAHLGALVFLLSLAVNAALGWQVSDLALPPAQRQPVGPGRYAVLVERAPLPPVGGMPAHRLTLLRDGQPLRRAPLNAGQPIRAGGLSVQQTALGSLVTAHSAAGQLEAYPRQGDAAETLSLSFGPQESERYFRSIASGASYRVTLTGAGLQVEAYRRGSAQPALRQTLRDGETLELDGERVVFSLGRYVILNVRQDPAWGGLLGGALLALAGVVLALFCRPGRLVWRLRQEGDSVQLTCAGDCPADLAACPFMKGDDGR